MDCVEVRERISEMFGLLTPYEVDQTRGIIDPHLLKCRDCRLYLREMYEQKRKEIRK